MATTMTFARVKQYLDAIADNPATVLDINNSPHERFWNVPYETFVNGNVPNVQCSKQPIPIIDHANPAASPFYVVLTSAAGICNGSIRQMPDGGAFITSSGYTAKLADGTTVTGSQIQNDLLNWLTNGFPER